MTNHAEQTVDQAAQRYEAALREYRRICMLKFVAAEAFQCELRDQAREAGKLAAARLKQLARLATDIRR